MQGIVHRRFGQPAHLRRDARGRKFNDAILLGVAGWLLWLYF
jgi:hypothetical protein